MYNTVLDKFIIFYFVLVSYQYHFLKAEHKTGKILKLINTQIKFSRHT